MSSSSDDVLWKVREMIEQAIPPVTSTEAVARSAMRKRRGQAWVGLAVVGVIGSLAVGVALTRPAPDERAPVEVAADPIKALASALGTGGGGGSWTSYDLRDLLPSAVVAGPDGKPSTPEASLVVVGRVTDVAEGRGFKPSRSDGSKGSDEDEDDTTAQNLPQVSFDDPEAAWKTIHATVEVESVVDGAPAVKRVTVGYVVDPAVELSTFADGLRSLGRAVFFLSAGSPMLDYDDGLLSGVANGHLIVTIDGSEKLALPLVDPGSAARFVSATPTLTALFTPKG